MHGLEMSWSYGRGYMDGYRAALEDNAAGTLPGSGNKDVALLSIAHLELSARAWNCLTRQGCSTIGDVMALPADTILRMRNLGVKSAAEIARALEKFQITDTAWRPFLIE